MIIGINILHDRPEILDNSSLFPTDDLFLYVKNLDERNYVVLIGCGEWAPDNEMYNLCLSTLKKFKQFKISKEDLKMYFANLGSEPECNFTTIENLMDKLKLSYEN